MKSYLSKSFLKYVAEDIIRDYGTDLSRIMVVFPNKRASLFLNEELMKIVQKPFWSPNYMTISDMFLQNTSLQLADPIKLIAVSTCCIMLNPTNK
mgnify:CR=1 FL=1